MKKISIIAPCYNESENLIIFYKKVKEIFNENLKDYDLDLIFVDNDSKDGSVEILRKLSESDKKVKVILNNVNYGLWRSTFNAIKYADGDALVPILPVDMQDPPSLIVDFIIKWEQGYDVV